MEAETLFYKRKELFMKRILAIFLSLIMTFSMMPSVYAENASDIELCLDLTVDGEHTVTVPSGSELTVTYRVINKTTNQPFALDMIGNEIYYDHNFVEIDETSFESTYNDTVSVHTYSDGEHRLYWNKFYHPAKTYDANQLTGTFSLTVLATSGQTTLNSVDSAATYLASSYQISSEGLTIIVGDDTPELYNVTYIDNGNVINTSQSAQGTITIMPAPPTPVGYRFIGWKAKGELYQPGESFSVTEDVTFEAQWEEIPVIVNYTLTFNTNGGTAISTLTQQEGTIIDLSSYTPSKTGFTFAGWYEDEELTTGITSVTLNTDKTVYAKWEEYVPTSYTLTFNTNGGSEISPLIKTEGTVVDLAPYTSSKANYTFAGWYEDEALTQPVSSVTMSSDKTVYAKWIEMIIGTYTLTFNTKGGSAISPVIQPEGTIINLADYTPSKSGYSFEGWYQEEALINPITSVTLNANTTVYAKWARNSEGGGGGVTVSKYTITFKDIDDTELGSAKYKVNTTVDLTDHKVEKDGYTFEGWYTDKELTESVTKVTVTKDMTLYAKWVENAPSPSKPDNHPQMLTKEHYAYIVGRENNRIEPMANITRAEVATIFFRLLTEEIRSKNMTRTNVFDDVNENDWFNTAVSTLANMGIVLGRTESTFEPNAFITRAEFTTIAARFSDVGYEGNDMFSDIRDHWAKDYINEAASIGWVIGDKGFFRPDDNITRAEAMTLVNRVLGRLPENEADMHADMIRWVDNADPDAWYYIYVQEATNSHKYEMKEDGIHEKWTELTENPNWIELEN